MLDLPGGLEIDFPRSLVLGNFRLGQDLGQIITAMTAM